MVNGELTSDEKEYQIGESGPRNDFMLFCGQPCNCHAVCSRVAPHHECRKSNLEPGQLMLQSGVAIEKVFPKPFSKTKSCQDAYKRSF